MNKNKVYKTKENVEFEVMPMSWAKRRTETKIYPKVESVTLSGFEFIKSHLCTVHVEYDNGTDIVLDSKVSYSCSYIKDASGLREVNGKWTVQGHNYYGHSILLKILTEKSL